MAQKGLIVRGANQHPTNPLVAMAFGMETMWFGRVITSSIAQAQF